MSDRIRYQYDNLEAFARKFADHAQETAQVRSRLTNQLLILESGGWLGDAAKRFSAEMREMILPALDNLGRALEGADFALRRACELMRDAEEEAAAKFRAADADSAAGTASIGASSGPSSTAQVNAQINALTTMRDSQNGFIQDMRQGMNNLGGQIVSVQAAYDRLIAEAAARAERMTALIGTLKNGTAS